MRHIGTPRKALRSATKTRGRRPWAWVVLVIAVNLMLSMSFVLMADRRLAEVEERMVLTLAGREAWRGELASVRSARSELGVEVAELRRALTELGREAGADEADLRSGLDKLGGRVERIEGMVMVLWRAPAGSTRARISSVPQTPDDP